MAEKSLLAGAPKVATSCPRSLRNLGQNSRHHLRNAPGVVFLRFTTSLNKNHEFKRLYNKGKSVSSQLVVVYSRRNGRAANRLGITVSTKVGGAVDRNRVRRRLREIYRLNEDKLLPGFDIVIVARVRGKQASYKELEASVLSVFKRSNIVGGVRNES